MSTWLIGGATPEAGGKTPEQLNIESLSIRYLNQQADECAIGFFLDIDDDLPDLFTSSNPIDIYRDGTRVFRGEIDGTSSAASTQESRSCKLYGAWRYLEQTPWIQNTDIGVRSDGVISGSVRDALIDIIDACPEVHLGVISPDFDLPGEMSISKSSLADVIRKILKLAPGHVVRFDYSSGVPQCHIRHYNDGGAPALTIGQAASAITRTKKQNKCRAVNLHYDRKRITTIDGQDSAENLFRVHSDCYPGELYGRHTFVLSRTLSGAERFRTKTWTMDIVDDSHYMSYLMTQGGIHALFGFRDYISMTPADLPDWISDGSVSQASNFSYGIQALSPLIADIWAYKSRWVLHKPSNSVPSEFLAADEFRDGVQLMQVDGSVDFRHVSTGEEYTGVTFSFISHCIRTPNGYYINVDGRSITREYNESDSEMESAPSTGTAQAIYNALNEDSFSGSITLPGYCDQKATRALVVNGDGVLVDTAPIQDLTYDLAADESRISFGSPRHLTPNEIISLRKAYN